MDSKPSFVCTNLVCEVDSDSDSDHVSWETGRGGTQLLFCRSQVSLLKS